MHRTCLKDIPDHLMLALKRFSFDHETYSRYKINDYFAFPMSIDMTPYTFDRLAHPEKSLPEDMFDLVGVIVHKGQAEHGHYISYIRARPLADGETPTWLLFDDSDVTVFDPKDLGEACFGGPANKDSNVIYGPSVKSYNAYMLFYQRRSSIQQHPWATEGSKNLRNVPVVPDMASEVTQDNRAHLERYSLFGESSREYVRCLIGKLKKLDHDDAQHELQGKLLGTIWKYLTHIWVRTKDIPGLEEAMAMLRDLGSECKLCCYTSIRWMIRARVSTSYWSEDILRDLLLKINQPKVRGLFRSFIIEAIKQIRDNEGFYGADITKYEPTLTGTGAIVVLTRLAQFIPADLVYNFRAWDDYFGLMADIAALGPQESLALISEGVLTYCFELILCGAGYPHEIEGIHYREILQMMKRKPKPSWNQLIRLTAILLDYVDMKRDAISDSEARNRLDWHRKDGVPWTDHEELMVMDFNKKDGGLVWFGQVLEKWNTEDDGFPPGDIVKSLLRGKSALVHAVVQTFVNSIKDFENRYADPFLRCAKFLPIYLSDRTLLEEVFRTMRQCSRDANGTGYSSSDGYNGEYCHRFWYTVYQITMGKLDARLDDRRFFDQHFLDTCPEWGPVLLAYTDDWQVGRRTQLLLTEAIFKSGRNLLSTDIRSLNDMDVVVTLTFWGCERQVRLYSAMGDRVWQQWMSPIYHIMAECVSHLQQVAEEEFEQEPDTIAENENIFSRFDGK